MSRDVLAARPTLRRAIYRACFAIVPLIPLPLGRLLAWVLGCAAWWIDTRGRRQVAENLARLVPEATAEARRRCARRCYVSFAISTVEALHLPRIGSGRLKIVVDRIVDPWGAYAPSPVPGPVIHCLPHANWELAGPAMRAHGVYQELWAISLSHGDEVIDDLFDRARGSVGIRSVLLSQAPLTALRVLADGGQLAIVGDRDYSGGGLRVPFLQSEIAIPVGPAALAVQTGARLLPVLFARVGWSRFRMFVGRPLSAQPGVNRREEVRRLTRELARLYERYLQAVPAQWVAFHPVVSPPQPGNRSQ